MVKKRKEEKKYDTINVYPSTRERFSMKFKQYKETDDQALTRLLDLAGVQK